MTNALISRVGSDVITGTVKYDKAVDKFIALAGTGSIKRVVFQDYSCCGDPSLQERVQAGQLPPPPGYQVDYTALELGFKGVLDTRLSHPEARTESVRP